MEHKTFISSGDRADSSGAYSTSTVIGIHSASSAEADGNLRNAENIKGYLAENKDNMIDTALSGHLMLLLEEKGIRRSDVVAGSGLDRAYVYQIFSGERNPSRDKLICIAFGLSLTEEEAQRMLKIGGYSELYPRLGRDAVILFAIQRGMRLDDAEELLYENGYPTLLKA